MLTFAGLLTEVAHNRPACAAMDLIAAALARRSPEQQAAFWRAIDLYYVSRKAPGAEAPAPDAEPRAGDPV